MKKFILLFSVVWITISCSKHEGSVGKKEWFSYEFEAVGTTTPKEITADELNIESYYRGVYAERVRLNIEQQREISFTWNKRGLTYTVTAFLSGGTISASNERRTDPQPPPPPPQPQFRKK